MLKIKARDPKIIFSRQETDKLAEEAFGVYKKNEYFRRSFFIILNWIAKKLGFDEVSISRKYTEVYCHEPYSYKYNSYRDFFPEGEIPNEYSFIRPQLEVVYGRHLKLEIEFTINSKHRYRLEYNAPGLHPYISIRSVEGGSGMNIGYLNDTTIQKLDLLDGFVFSDLVSEPEKWFRNYKK